ncbi:hypothetical protein DSECCO2_99650 [anaerobic digester metagenome]
MTEKYQEEIGIILKARGKNEVNAEAEDLVTVWRNSFQLIKNSIPDINQFSSVIDNVRESIAEGFNLTGVDWSDLFDGMDEQLARALDTIDLSFDQQWDSILGAMFASGMDTADISDFVNSLESSIQAALDEIDIKAPSLDMDQFFKSYDELINYIKTLHDTYDQGGIVLFSANDVVTDKIKDVIHSIENIDPSRLYEIKNELDTISSTIDPSKFRFEIDESVLSQLESFRRRVDELLSFNQTNIEIPDIEAPKLNTDEFFRSYDELISYINTLCDTYDKGGIVLFSANDMVTEKIKDVIHSIENIDPSRLYEIKTELDNISYSIESSKFSFEIDESVLSHLEDFRKRADELLSFNQTDIEIPEIEAPKLNTEPFFRSYDELLSYINTLYDTYDKGGIVLFSVNDDVTEKIKDVISSIENIDPSRLYEIKNELDTISSTIEQSKFSFEIDEGILSHLESFRQQADELLSFDQNVDNLKDSFDQLNDLDEVNPEIDYTSIDIAVQKIQGIFNSFKTVASLGIDDIFNPDNLESFSTTVSDLSSNQLEYLNIALLDFSDRINNLNIDDIVKSDALSRVQSFLDLIEGAQLDPIIDALNQIREEFDKLGESVDISIEDLFDSSSIFNFKDAIADLNNYELEQLYNLLNQVVENIEELNINSSIKSGVLDQFREYLDILNDVNEAQNKTATEGGTKVAQFLDRYKYSLALVGGALGGILGMMRYSTTFGAAIEILGQAVGYLADVIMYPLLPYVMGFAEWIIALADYINGLPEPIKFVISGLTVLAVAFGLFKAFGGTTLFRWLKEALDTVMIWMDEAIGLLKIKWAAWNSAMLAGGLTGGLAFAAAAGVGILLGFAAIYALIQTGVMNTISKFGSEFQKTQPTLAAMVTAWLGPIALIAIPLIDAAAGQFDLIPMHMDLAAKMINESWKILALSVMTSINDMGIAIQGFMSSIGSLLQKNPLTKGMGEALSGWADENKKKFEDDKKIIEGYIKSKQDLVKQYRNIMSTGVNVDNKEAEFKPGSFLNGITSEDQRKYYEQLDLLKELNDTSSVEGILAKYNSKVQPGPIDDTTSNLTDLQEEIDSLIKTVEPGSASFDEYLEKINDLSYKLSDSKDKMDALNDSTKTNLDLLDSRSKIINEDSTGNVPVSKDDLVNKQTDLLKEKATSYEQIVTKTDVIKQTQEEISSVPGPVTYEIESPDVSVTISKIQTWWDSVKSGLSLLVPFNTDVQNTLDFSVITPDVDLTVSKIQSWWDDVKGGLSLSAPVQSPDITGSSQIPLPSSPIPSNENQIIIIQNQQPDTDSKPGNVYITIQGYQKDEKQLANEIAKIWDSRARGSRI